ncbi:acyl-CoA N-acyltransferase [Xylaria sp. FL0064]|nr:acyl-CoA N-acyltransferase [Xylaria sp. FL0064]
MSSPLSSSATARNMPVSIQPLEVADIPTCAKITAAAFAVDPHTVVKQLGREPFDIFTITCSNLEDYLKLQHVVCVKAVDEQGTIVGHASWTFKDAEQQTGPSKGTGDEHSIAEDPQAEGPEKTKEREETEEDPIERLHALEDADMQYWLQSIVPKDKARMIVLGLIVAPNYQGQGIGSALLRHGNALADERSVPIWVHSSHQAYNLYRKGGFETRRELRIDLDEYTPRPPRDDEPTMAGDHEGKWGEYVIRYMERKPSGNRGA